MNENAEQIAKTVEHGAITLATSTGAIQLLLDHRELILMFCTIGGFVIGFLSWLTTWYYKSKAGRRDERQQRRKNDAN